MLRKISNIPNSAIRYEKYGIKCTPIAPSKPSRLCESKFALKHNEKCNRMGSEINDELRSKIVIVYWLIDMFGFELLNVSIAQTVQRETANCIVHTLFVSRVSVAALYCRNIKNIFLFSYVPFS